MTNHMMVAAKDTTEAMEAKVSVDSGGVAGVVVTVARGLLAMAARIQVSPHPVNTSTWLVAD